MSLEDILRENTNDAERVLTSHLNLTAGERTILEANKPKIEVVDTPGIQAGYDFLNNRYVFSKDAIKDVLAVGEEVAHSIRLRLNSTARNYLLNPLNQAKRNIKDYIKKINLEEYFGRYGALIYANSKGVASHNKLWSNIKGFLINLTSNPLEYISHFFGYKKAEKDYSNKGTKGFNKDALYGTNSSIVYA